MAIKSTQTADQIINSVLLRIGDLDLLRYNEAVDFFIDIYRDTQTFYVSQTKDVVLDISPIGVVCLPDDFVDYVKIGVPIGGSIFTFTRRGDIIRLETDPLGNNVNTDMGEGEDVIVNDLETLAVGGYNPEGYFDFDKTNNRILVRNYNENTSQVILRYVTTGIDTMESTYVPSEAINMIKAELEYKLELRNPKLTNGVKALMLETVDRETEKLNSYNLPTLEEFIDVIYETSGRGARRW